MATRLAKFPWVRTLDDFDFTAQPTLEPKHLRELALCRWVGNGDGLLLLGPPGVGKPRPFECPPRFKVCVG
jgi:DNA replication protein DnaC